MPVPSDTGAAAATRELAAIMFSDIAGYTLIMGRDEDKAIRALAEHREVLRCLLPKFNGRLIGEIGDGTLSSFHSALDAVNCAREVQAALKDDPEMRLRIGIHVGDVLFKDGTVLGDGVNVASRIHALAPPGGICVSDRVYDEIRNKPEILVKDLGEQTLKNVSRPIRVYAMAVPGIKFERSIAHEFRTTRTSWILKRRLLWLGAGLGLLVALLGFCLTHYVEIATAARIYGPRFIPAQLKQELGFCRTTDGVRIAYGTVGRGPPVVMVPGGLTDVARGVLSPMYDASALEPIAARHLLVQYDGRGFGMSDRGLRDYSLEAKLRDLEAVVDALKLNRFALYAWGAGGPVAIAYAVRHPERVTRIAFNGAYANASASVLKGEERERQEPVFSLMEKRWDDPAFREMWASLLMPNGSAVDRAVFTKLQNDSATLEDFVAFLKADDEIDTTALLSQIKAPALVVHLRSDQLVPLEYGRQLAARIPGARFVIVEGRDKMAVPGDGEVEQYNQALLPFFDEDLPRQAGAATPR